MKVELVDIGHAIVGKVFDEVAKEFHAGLECRCGEGFAVFLGASAVDVNVRAMSFVGDV